MQRPARCRRGDDPAVAVGWPVLSTATT